MNNMYTTKIHLLIYIHDRDRHTLIDWLPSVCFLWVGVVSDDLSVVHQLYILFTSLVPTQQIESTKVHHVAPSYKLSYLCNQCVT